MNVFKDSIEYDLSMTYMYGLYVRMQLSEINVEPDSSKNSWT